MGNLIDEDENSPNKRIESSALNINNEKYKTKNNINEKSNSNSQNKSLLSKKHIRSEESNDEDNIINKILKINDDIKKISEKQIAIEKGKLIKEIEDNNKK